MSFDTSRLPRSIQTLESSLDLLNRAQSASIEYEIFRNAVVKGFELTLETAGKLLRRALKDARKLEAVLRGKSHGQA